MSILGMRGGSGEPKVGANEPPTPKLTTEPYELAPEGTHTTGTPDNQGHVVPRDPNVQPYDLAPQGTHTTEMPGTQGHTVPRDPNVQPHDLVDNVPKSSPGPAADAPTLKADKAPASVDTSPNAGDTAPKPNGPVDQSPVAKKTATPENRAGTGAAEDPALVEQAKFRASEIVKTQSGNERGPNLTLLKDTKTGQVFESQNLEKFDPSELDPIMQNRYNQLMRDVAEGKVPKYEKWQVDSMHSEIKAASDAIKARRAAGIPVPDETPKEFEIANVVLRGKTTGQMTPQCPYCKQMLPEVRDVGMEGSR